MGREYTYAEAAEWVLHGLVEGEPEPGDDFRAVWADFAAAATEVWNQYLAETPGVGFAAAPPEGWSVDLWHTATGAGVDIEDGRYAYLEAPEALARAALTVKRAAWHNRYVLPVELAALEIDAGEK